MNQGQETTISIQLQTGYYQSGESKERAVLQEMRQKLEKSAHYLSSIFNTIGSTSADLLARVVDDGSSFEISTFLDDVQHLSEIGKSISDSIHTSVVPILSLEIGSDQIGSDPIAAGSAGNSEIDAAAAQLSSLLLNETLPEHLRDAISSAITELYNAHIDQSEIIQYEKSPEYISRVLRGLPAQ